MAITFSSIWVFPTDKRSSFLNCSLVRRNWVSSSVGSSSCLARFFGSFLVRCESFRMNIGVFLGGLSACKLSLEELLEPIEATEWRWGASGGFWFSDRDRVRFLSRAWLATSDASRAVVCWISAWRTLLPPFINASGGDTNQNTTETSTEWTQRIPLYKWRGFTAYQPSR